MREAGTRSPRPVPLRGRGFRPIRGRAAGFLGAVAALAAWELASRAGWINSEIFPGPAEIGETSIRLLLDGDLSPHLAASLRRLGAGWSIGTAAGLALGLALGLLGALRAAGLGLVWGLAAVPQVALLPLFFVWFGSNEAAKIAMIAFGVLFPIVISTAAAVVKVDRGLIRMAQSYGVPRMAIVRKVVLPAALPGILAGLGYSTPIAIILLVASEMIEAQEGLGAFVFSAGYLMQTNRLLAGVAILSLIGLTAGGAFRGLERLASRRRQQNL